MVRAATVRAATVRAAMIRAATVMETVTLGQENRTSDKEQRPVEPRVPVILLGIRVQADRLWRQRVDLLRQTGSIQRYLATAMRLPTRLPDGLLFLALNRHLHGELAAILKSWDECSVRCVRGNLPDAPRHDRHHADTQRDAHINLPDGS